MPNRDGTGPNGDNIRNGRRRGRGGANYGIGRGFGGQYQPGTGNLLNDQPKKGIEEIGTLRAVIDKLADIVDGMSKKP